jgi:phage replication-related protein YjqB (UPF0714/DUF867 family)
VRRSLLPIPLVLAAATALAADRYASFAELARATREGVDWRVEARAGRTGVLVLAPHGGGIEAGTSELARAVAGDDHSLYLFEGLRARDNGDLHITSTRFDEPRLAPLLADARRVLSLHGCQGREPVAYVGGRDEALARRVTEALGRIGVAARPPEDALAGADRRNVCNRGRSGAGVQVELTRALRAELVEGLDPAGRTRATPALGRLAAALREALAP